MFIFAKKFIQEANVVYQFSTFGLKLAFNAVQHFPNRKFPNTKLSHARS
jgi:hypothetical protein